MRGHEKELPLLLFNKNKSKLAHIVPPIWNKKAHVIVLLKIARSQAKQVVYALHFCRRKLLDVRDTEKGISKRRFIVYK